MSSKKLVLLKIHPGNILGITKMLKSYDILAKRLHLETVKKEKITKILVGVILPFKLNILQKETQLVKHKINTSS